MPGLKTVGNILNQKWNLLLGLTQKIAKSLDCEIQVRVIRTDTALFKFL